MTDFHDIPAESPETEKVWRRLIARGDALYAEYAAQPTGAHSPDLQFVLQRFRKAPCAGKFVLIALDPHRRWALGRLTGTRGQPVVRLAQEFTDLAEAERHVFRLRWQEMTGEELAHGQ